MNTWHILPSLALGQNLNLEIGTRERERRADGWGVASVLVGMWDGHGTVHQAVHQDLLQSKEVPAHPAYPAKPRGKREGRVSGTLGTKVFIEQLPASNSSDTLPQTLMHY